MDFFVNPNSPNKCSSCVLVSPDTDDEALKTLIKSGIEPIFSYRSKIPHPSVSAHPDMTITHLGGALFVCSPDSYEYYNALLPDAEIIAGPSELGPIYPRDVGYNVTVLGDYIFMNTATDQIKISEMYPCMKKKILNVRQGYTKCNICVVDGNSLITSDKGIYSAAENNKIDALLIRPGYIELSGMNYGFIGGASGLIAPDTLALNGDIKTHPDADRIISFCKKRGVNILSLKSGTITDIGSILPLF